MIDTTTVSKAIFERLSFDLQEAAVVERCEFINEDINRMPWVGVYRVEERYAPASQGRHDQSWRCLIKIALVAQTASLKDGAQCEERMGDIVNAVISSLWNEPVFGGVIEKVNSFLVRYSMAPPNSEYEKGGAHFQTALIEVEGEVLVG